MNQEKDEFSLIYESLKGRDGLLKVLLFSEVNTENNQQLLNLKDITVKSTSVVDYSHKKGRFYQSIDWVIITENELNKLNLDLFLSCVNLQKLVIAEATEEIKYGLQRQGFVKICDSPLVYQWQNKTEWGTFLLSQQKFIQAISAFQSVLQEDPWNVTALTQLGLLCVKIEDFAEAEILLQQALKRERRNPFIMEKLARVWVTLNQYTKAIEILEHLVITQPENISAWFLLERCYHQKGEEQKAINAYEYRCALNNKNTRVDISTCLWGQPQAQLSPQRILVINNLYPPQELGGYGRRICDFANVLRQRGHTTYTLTSDAPYLGIIKSPENHINRELILCGTYEKLPPKFYEDEDQVNQILYHNNQVIQTVIADFEPDVCLIGNIDLLSHTVFQPLLEQAIPVMHLLGFEQPGYPVECTPDSPLYYMAANSEYGRQGVLTKNYPLKDIGVVYPGAFINQFQMCCLPSFDQLRIVFASLVLPYKGPQVLLQALALLQEKNIEFHCSIAGDAPNQEFLSQLKHFVQEHNIDHQVDFLGYLARPQLIDLFATHNVLVFPSVWEEPFGRSQVEAMAAGLTLITSGTGGSGEVIEPDISGLLFEAGNAEALAEKLISLVKSPEKWEKITISGKEKAQEFDINQSIDLIENKFKELLNIRDNNLKLLQQKIQAQLKLNLRLRETNYIIFPDWNISEELLSLSLAEVIRNLIKHPNQKKITLLIDTHDISDEDADAIISSLIMSLLMEEELDIEDGLEITLVGELEENQWLTLLPLLQGRIILNCDNLEVIRQIKADHLDKIELNSIG